MFEAPKYREERGHFLGSSAAQAGNVVDSTLEIIEHGFSARVSKEGNPCWSCEVLKPSCQSFC